MDKLSWWGGGLEHRARRVPHRLVLGSVLVIQAPLSPFSSHQSVRRLSVCSTWGQVYPWSLFRAPIRLYSPVQSPKSGSALRFLFHAFFYPIYTMKIYPENLLGLFFTLRFCFARLFLETLRNTLQNKRKIDISKVIFTSQGYFALQGTRLKTPKRFLG